MNYHLRFVLFTLLKLTLCTSANAINCFDEISQNFSKQINIANFGASLEFELLLKKSILRVNENLGPLKVPTEYQIELEAAIEHTQNGNGPNNMMGVIKTAEFYSVVNKQGKLVKTNPSFTHAIGVHEYGHEVFAVNIGQYITHPELKKAYDIRDKFVYHRDRIYKLRTKISRLRRSGVEDSRIKKSKFHHNLQESSALLNPIMQEYNAIELKSITTPFDELFADFIAVIGTNDPKAIHRASGNSSSKKGRDFTSNLPIHNWQEESVHRMYGPVRSFLWSRYMNNPSYKEHLGLVAEGLIKAIAKEIDEILLEGLTLTSSQRNIRLIEKIIHEIE
ncbi:hypothetical protein M899_0550 [Bacteriovorax sp. BSW11_IV]|uniref:hypothetical protein n=1 Tax=Bacteriovorax sp. BSW11_IV TaxID=1353529 RepID=UPI00038A2670|nr:hypothetical protein [Bacteriovorax sp. BSW11_IV]EQC45035.1 hypothetical protein M899_0550 [Bacteriovorax sp. BSW11_IV]